MTPSGFNRAANSGRLAAAGLFGLLICVPAGRAQIGVAPPVVAEARRTVQPVSPGFFDGAMEFYVATGPADACGPGCREWIAAEGMIDRDAGRRFKEFLNSPRRRSLPVFFNSQGGILSGAIDIANALRDYQMTAGVGRTTQTGCTTRRLAGGVCDQMLKAGNDVPSRIAFDAGQCHSACVYAVIGATRRQIAAGARIGVHSPRTDEKLWKQYVDRNPGVTRVAEIKRRIALWHMVLSMGVDPELVNVSAKVDPLRLHFLSRDEINRFGLASRAQFETPWRSNPDTSTVVRLYKLVNAQSGANTGIGLTATIALSCRSQTDLILTYQRKISAYEPVGMLQIRLTGGDGLNQRLDGRADGSLGVWGTVIGFDDLRHAAENSPLRIVETYSNEGAQLSVTLPATEIAPALAELLKECNERNVSAAKTDKTTD